MMNDGKLVGKFFTKQEKLLYQDVSFFGVNRGRSFWMIAKARIIQT